jgi:outer membrane protein TolC
MKRTPPGPGRGFGLRRGLGRTAAAAVLLAVLAGAASAQAVPPNAVGETPIKLAAPDAAAPTEASAPNGAGIEALIATALARDADLQTAAVGVKAAAAAVAADSPWRKLSVDLKTTLANGGSAPGAAPVAFSWSAAASLPLTDWFSLGLNTAGDIAKNPFSANLKLDASYQPFALAAEDSAGAALVNARNDYVVKLRERTLALRKALRQLILLDADFGLKQAKLAVAATALDKQQFLFDRGEAKHSDLLKAIGDKTDAQMAADKSEAALADAKAALADDFGLKADAIAVADVAAWFDADYAAAWKPATVDQWLSASASYRKAGVDAAAAERAAAQAEPKPNLTLGASLAPGYGSGAFSLGWSASANLKLNLDLVYRAAADAKAEQAALKRAAVATAEAAARQEYANKGVELARTEASYERARMSIEATGMVIAETRLLYGRGEKSGAEMASAEADGLQAAYQSLSGRVGLADLRDALDVRFLAILEN